MKEYTIWDHKGVKAGTVEAEAACEAIAMAKKRDIPAPMVRLSDWQQHEHSLYKQERQAERYARHAISDTVH